GIGLCGRPRTDHVPLRGDGRRTGLGPDLLRRAARLRHFVVLQRGKEHDVEVGDAAVTGASFLSISPAPGANRITFEDSRDQSTRFILLKQCESSSRSPGGEECPGWGKKMSRRGN